MPGRVTSPACLIPVLIALATACPAPIRAADDAPASPAPENRVTVSVTDWQGVEQNIRRHRGRPVMVDLWSTSCEPCLRELPGLARLQQELGKQVVCITVSLDYFGGKGGPSEELQREVLAVLKKHKVSAINLISSTPDETVYEQLDLAAVPAVYVYGSDGKLARRFDNEDAAYGEDGFTYERHILPFVRQQIAARGQ